MAHAEDDSDLQALRNCLDTNGIIVVGCANKAKIVPNVRELPEILRRISWPADIFPQRGDYLRIIQTLQESLGPICVVSGDSYQLDFLVPELLGMKTVLLTSRLTPEAERVHQEQHPNGTVALSLEGVKNAVLVYLQQRGK